MRPPVRSIPHFHGWTFLAVVVLWLALPTHPATSGDVRALRATITEQSAQIERLTTDVALLTTSLRNQTGRIDAIDCTLYELVCGPRASRSHVRKPLTESHRTTSRSWSVTAYCATGNRTASGLWPRVGMAATLDRSIPFGTRLRVPGAGVVTVTDRIGAHSDLDLYLGTGAACDHAARTWGRRTLTITEVPAP